MNKYEINDRVQTFITAELMLNPGYPLKEDEPIITGGLIDSFSLALLAVFIEETFDVYIPNSELTVEKMNTLQLIVDRIIKG